MKYYREQIEKQGLFTTLEWKCKLSATIYREYIYMEKS